MTTATIKIKDYTIQVTGTFQEASGKGFDSEPYIAEGWEISEILLNGEDIEYEYLAKLLQITESVLFEIFDQELWKQDKLDWESSYNFI